MEPCKYEDTIQYIKNDIKEIKADVKSLLQMKWQLFGGSAVIAFLIYLVSVIISFK